MCAKKEEETDCPQAMNNIQNYQDDLLLHHHQHMVQNQTQSTTSDIFAAHNNNVGFTVFPQESLSQAAVAALPWPLPPPPFQPFNPTREPDPFLLPPPPPPPPSFYGSFFNRRGHGLQFGYEGIGATSGHHHDHLRILSEALGPVVQAGSGPFGLQAELGKMTAQEIMDAKALAASKSHSEAERRRRERINNHLAKLRSILPNTTKTDKASLLAEVIQHVKELKRQTSLIAETNPIPTETDELTVDFSGEELEDGKFVIKASVCCDDRSDLLPDLVKTLKTLRLKTLKAEITTVGGRVKNVLFVTGEESDCDGDGDGDGYDQQTQPQYYISSIQEALKAVMEKSSMEESSSSGNAKRQRMSNSVSIIEQQQQHR